jgi:hypothetical protein
VATRGSNLELWRFGDGLVLRETGGADAVDEAHFDVEDVDCALAELDERYVAEMGATFAPILNAGRAMVNAANHRDWDTFGALHAPDVVSVDHEPVYGGVLQGSAAIVESNQAMADLTTSVRARIESIERITPSKALINLGTELVTLDGDRYDTAFVCVATFDGERFSRFEWFPHDQIDQARVRFDELPDRE